MQRWGRLAVVVGVTFWALGNLIVRDSPLDGPRLALWRYVIGAAVYIAVHLWLEGPLKWAEAKLAAPAALAITVEIALFFTAIQRTTVANVTVIAALVPLILVAVGVRRYGEQIPAAVLAAGAVGLIGVSTVVYGSAGAVRWTPSGDALAFVALGFFAAYFVFAKDARASLSAVTLQTWTMIIGIPVLVVAAAFYSDTLAPPSGTDWLYPLGLIAIPSTGHLLVNWSHRYVTLTFASLLTLGVPVLSSVGAWAVFGDELNGVQLAGMAVVLAVLAFVVVEGERGRFRHSQPAADQESAPTSTT